MTVDASIFTERTRTLLRRMGRSESEFLEEQAGLLFRDVSKFTPPFANKKLPSFGRDSYGTGKDKKAGEIAVRRDLRNSMVPVAPASKWESPSIQKAVRRKDKVALQRIFDNATFTPYQGFSVVGFDSMLHQRDRDMRGRVNTSKRRLAVGHTLYARYRAKLLKTVGRGKAPFAWAAQQMGRKQAPKWISRHFWRYRAKVERGEGYIQATSRGGALVHTVRFLKSIEKNRARSAEARLEKLLKGEAKAAGFSGKGLI